MHSELRAQVAFRLTGLRTEERPDPNESRNLRPALTARYRNLPALRHDFPVVLPTEPVGDEFALSLVTIVDRLVAQAAPDDQPKARAALGRIEREIRTSLNNGASGTLLRLWDAAVERLSRDDKALSGISLGVRKNLAAVDGEVRDCDAGFAGAFVLRAWKVAQKRKATRFHEELNRLIVGLGDILTADEARSTQARGVDRLRESFGNVHREVFDFEAMSRLLGRSAIQRPLSEVRRRRLRSLLVTLESQRFFLDESGFSFDFDRCSVALRTFRARYARLRSLARSVAMARLEVAHEYDETRHDALFQQLRQAPLTREELAGFPDYLVRVRDVDLEGAARAELMDLLCSGIPAKLLVQADDILEDAAFGGGLAGVAARCDAVTGIAIGLNDVFVLQTSASNLPRMAAQVLEALEYPGATVLSVFSGATGDSACLPPYLNAAAAAESRAFPTFAYDPRKGFENESRFSIEGNPQPDGDWPVHGFDYEDADHQRIQEELRFTIADFVAADERFGRHFLSTPRCEGLVGVAQWIDGKADADADTPVVPVVNARDELLQLVVDEPILELARRGLDRWHRLQKLAKMGTPIVREVAVQVPVEAPPAGQVPASAPAAAPSPAPAPAPAVAAEAPKAPASDDPYIETPRCTTCNECTTLNNKLFAYDANKQAYIADPSAGTYKDLVEAAESCQVSIIHPGKPRNPDEPGLEELKERALPFL